MYGCVIEEVDINDALSHNKSFTNSADMNKNREKFIEKCNEKNFKRIIVKYVDRARMYKKIKRKLKKILNRIN